MIVWAGAIQPSRRFSFLLVTSANYFSSVISIIQGDCVCMGHTAISQISFYIFVHQGATYFRLLIRIILLCICVCKGHTASLHISSVILWLCVQGPYSHPTDFILITYIGQLFQTFDKYNSVWLCVQGAIQPSHRFHFNHLHQWAISNFW